MICATFTPCAIDSSPTGHAFASMPSLPAIMAVSPLPSALAILLLIRPQTNEKPKASTTSGNSSTHQVLRVSVLRNSALIRLPITAGLPSRRCHAAVLVAAPAALGTAEGGTAAIAAAVPAAGTAAAAVPAGI